MIEHSHLKVITLLIRLLINLLFLLARAGGSQYLLSDVFKDPEEGLSY